MRATEQARLVGLSGRWHGNQEIVFDVKVTDAKFTYGRVTVLIEPVAGTGSKWVELTSVRLCDDDQ